eukprot:TRINITY_DN7058_c0_g1_i2.p1 TRINITY_DN7058_c0_g1~~TRINITY_DN7058_c0_g1_i2.p1  ORF type:complete len:321 (-),score=69.27 TRINITY_DN7058_c0_g1_i2:99-1061(-)
MPQIMSSEKAEDPVKNKGDARTNKDSNSGESIQTFKFQETPPISPHLVTFCLFPPAHFNEKEGTVQPKNIETGKEVRLRILSPTYVDETKRKQIWDCIAWSLQTLQDRFHCAFYLDKLDVIILPQMKLSGMEGWGCIFLNISDKKTTTSSNDPEQVLQSLQRDIIHEIAHQWIGNLLSLPLWVKEGIVLVIEDLLYALYTGQPSTAGAISLASCSSSTSLSPVQEQPKLKQERKTKEKEKTSKDSGRKAENSKSADKRRAVEEFENVMKVEMYKQARRFFLEYISHNNEEAFWEKLRRMLNQHPLQYLSADEFGNFFFLE